MCEIYSKLTNSFRSLHTIQFAGVFIADFEQVVAGWIDNLDVTSITQRDLSKDKVTGDS